MYQINKEKAKKILVTELNYKPTNADIYLQDYPPIHDELSEAVNQWLEDRSIKNISISGLSIKEIMETRRCHFLMAVQNLNRMLDEDLTPHQRERLIEILKKPVIRW